jgi:hypothetical protein
MRTLTIQLPAETVTVRPVPRANLSLFSDRMVELQSIWIAEEFSTGDAIALDHAWQLMQSIWCMLPLAETPSVTLNAESLESLSSDYEQLQALFFGDAAKAWHGAYMVDVVPGEKAPIILHNGELVTPRYVDLAWYAATGNFEVEAFGGCKLWELHEVSPRKKLIAADQLRRAKLQTAPSPPPTSRSKPAATQKQTRSQTSSTALEKSA